MKLRVAEASERDIGLGIARIDDSTRKALGIASGDVVKITGQRTTVSTVQALDAEDEGKGLVRIEAIIRGNARISLGSLAEVACVPTSPCESMELAPVYSGSTKMDFPPGLEAFLSTTLSGRALVSGDAVLVPGVFLMGGMMAFVVISTSPQEGVVVNGKTRINARPETVSESDLVASTRDVWENIGGSRSVLEQLREMITLPLKHPEIFSHVGVSPPRGILLYGPPGTGKTKIVDAVVNEVRKEVPAVYFIDISGAKLILGSEIEAAQSLTSIFEEAKRRSPSIIFMDEVDSLSPRRDDPSVGEREKRRVAHMLTLLDGSSDRGNVIVVGATNRIDAIDPALRRPGRFDREVEVGLPSEEDRSRILQIHTRPPLRLVGSDEDKAELISFLSRHTSGYAAADLVALVKEASMRAIRRFASNHTYDIETSPSLPRATMEQISVTKDDFVEALLQTVPSSRRGPRFDHRDVTGEA